eukprot:1196016-Prorocentrum_minimum.AAC.3
MEMAALVLPKREFGLTLAPLYGQLMEMAGEGEEVSDTMAAVSGMAAVPGAGEALNVAGAVNALMARLTFCPSDVELMTLAALTHLARTSTAATHVSADACYILSCDMEATTRLEVSTFPTLKCALVASANRDDRKNSELSSCDACWVDAFRPNQLSVAIC